MPVITTLAKNFKTFTRWFSSVPSCTDPNKLFLHAAQSGSNTDNCGDWFCEGYPFEAKTIYENVKKDGKKPAIHYMDWAEAMAISPLNKDYDIFVHDVNF